MAGRLMWWAQCVVGMGWGGRYMVKHQRADKLFIPAVQGEVACQRTKLLQQAGSTHAPAVRVCKRVCICVYVCTRACACVCALIAACTGVACTGVHAHAPDNASHCHSNACCLLGCHGLMEQHHTTRQDDERFNMADHIIRQGAVCGGGGARYGRHAVENGRGGGRDVWIS